MASVTTTEGKNYLLGAAIKGSVSPISTWFVSAYKANVTPVNTWTAANWVALGTEVVSSEVTQATRPAFTLGTVSGGSVSNSASPARITASAGNTITLYGAVLASTSAWAAVTGTLLAAIPFAASKTLVGDDGDYLDITITITVAD